MNAERFRAYVIYVQTKHGCMLVYLRRVGRTEREFRERFKLKLLDYRDMQK